MPPQDQRGFLLPAFRLPRRQFNDGSGYDFRKQVGGLTRPDAKAGLRLFFVERFHPPDEPPEVAKLSGIGRGEQGGELGGGFFGRQAAAERQQRDIFSLPVRAQHRQRAIRLYTATVA